MASALFARLHRRIAPTALAGGLIVAVVGTAAAAPDFTLPSTVSDSAPLRALVTAEQDAFTPVTPEQLATNRQELKLWVTRLAHKLQSNPAGTGWADFLEWNDLLKQVDDGAQPDLAVLDRLAEKFHAMSIIWPDPLVFDTLAELDQYTARVRVVHDRVDAKVWSKQVDQLAAAIAAGDAQRAAVETSWQWLVAHGWRGPAAFRVAESYSHPNMLVRIGGDLLRAQVAAAIQEDFPITDVITGSRVSGHGTLAAKSQLTLVPDDHRGVFELHIDGTSYSRTFSSGSGVGVNSSSTTPLTAVKRLVFDGRGLWDTPTSADASTSIQYNGISAPGRRRRRRIATEQVYARRGQAEYESADHTEQQIRGLLDNEAAALAVRVNDVIERELRDPLADSDALPQQLTFRTRATDFQASVYQAPRFSFAAADAAPDEMPAADLAFQVHDSYFQQLTSQAWGGKSVAGAQLAADLERMFGSKQADKPAAGPDAWKVRFASGEPATVEFSDAGLRIVLHGQEFTAPGKSYPAMDITAQYRWKFVPGRLTLVRDEAVQVYPGGYVPGGPKRMSGREQTLRQLVKRLIGPLFPEQLTLERWETPAEWSAGGFSPTHWQVHGHWITLGLQHVAAVPAVATRP